MGDFTADPDDKTGLKKGKKSDGRPKEGKVAGTDNYGDGGPQAKGNGVPGKSSGTEHLPHGPNGASGPTIGQQNGVDAKEAKQPNAPTGGGKGTAGDKGKDGKQSKDGAKDAKPAQADHVGAGAEGKKDAAGKDVGAKTAAKAPTAQGPVDGKADKAPAPMYAGKPAAPAVKVDPAAVAPVGDIKIAALPPIGKALADKWIKETGRPPEVHWVQIQGAVSMLSSEVQRAQNDFKTYSDTAAQKLQTELDNKTMSFASSVTAPGRQRVLTAYATMNKTVETSSQKALTDITAHKQNGTKQIQTTLPAKKTEVTKKLEAAKTTVKTLIDKHSPAATKEIQAFGTKVTPEIETRKKAANEKAKKEAEKFDPKAGNGDQRGGSALEGGKLSLKNDVYNQLIVAEGKKLGDEYDGTLRPVITDIEKQAPKWVATEVSDQIGTLTAILESYDKTTVSGVDKTAKDTTAQLDAQEVTAKKSVADAKTSSLKKIETEQKSALEAADAAGKDLLENTKQAGTELIDRLKKKAADDSKTYATVTAGLDKTLQKRGPHRFESIQPQIDTAKQQLAKLSDANKQSLDQMANQGMIDLSAAITKNQDIYQQAIKNREEQAVKVELEIRKDVSKGADDLGATLSGIGTAFTDTVTKETAKIDTAVAQFNTTADAGLKDFSAKLKGKLDKIQTDANAAFDEGFKAKFAEKDKLVQAADETIKAKEKQGVTDAGKLRGAFDGYGTDEEAVFAVLRVRTYGEIEFLQGAYNHHYDNRGQAKTTKFAGKEVKLGDDSKLTPLKYDIDDEMSGSDFKIAMAYLEHHRQDAIQLEIKDASTGMFGTDGKRVEAVLRTCNDEEIHHLNTDESAKRTVMVARTMMFDQCNTDVMDTLLDEKVKKEERTSKADAIRLFDAMKGPGTDEAKMTEILEGAQTDEQRAALRKNFNEYAAKRGWETGTPGDENNDALALAIKDDTSGGEQAVFLEQAKVHRDDGMLKMAKAYKAADGGGTDEALLFESLEDDHYAEEWEKAKPEERAAIEAAHKKLLDGRLATITGSKDKDRGTIDGLIEDETTKAPFTWQELLDGKKKDGTPIDVAQWKVLLRDLQSGFLEYLLAERTLQIGRLDPTLALAYACWGVTGTDEELINKAISKNGEPLSQKAVKKIKSDFRLFWGVNLVDNEDEFARPTKDPGGLLSAELGGKDWFKTRILLCGIPENAKQEHYVNNLRFDYASSGALGGVFMDAMEAVGATEAKSTAEHSRKREQEAYQQNFVDKKIEEKSYEDIRKEADQASKDDKDPAKKKDPKALQEALQNAKNVDEFLLLSKEMEIDATAYAETKSALIDAVITTLELIGGVLISIGTMGAGSPILAAFLANLAMSAGGIILKAVIKGDQYGAGDFATDAVAAIGSAGFGALGETKAVVNAAEGVGKRLTGTVFKAAEEGLEQGGVQVAKVGSKWGIELSKEGMAKVERIVAAGAKNVMMSTGQEVYGFVTDEKTYDMKLGEALWGENSLGKRILAGAPRAFATGAVSDWINQYAHTSTLDYPKGTPGSAMKNALWNAVAEMGGNTAGFFLYPDNYESSEHFWKELFKSNVQSGLTGFASGYLMHKNRHKKLAAEFIRGELDHDGLMNLVHDKTLDSLEQQKLAEFVMAHGTDEAKAALPEHYKKLIGAKPQLPVADPNAPAGTTAAATTTAPDVKKSAPPDKAGDVGDPSPVEPIEHKTEQKKPAAHDEEKKQQAQAKVDEAKNQAPEQQPSMQTTPEPETAKKSAVANDNVEGQKKPAVAPTEVEQKKSGKGPAATPQDPAIEPAHKPTAKQLDQGHAGIEVHSHFMGNVEAESMANVVGKSVTVAGQVSQWEPILHALDNLDTTFDPKKPGEPSKDGLRHGKNDPNKPTSLENPITKRGKSGDALDLVREATKEIATLKQEMREASEGTGRYAGKTEDERKAKVSELTGKIDEKAHNAVKKALQASDETDFNSSYEIRDELVKAYYGAEQRNAVVPGGKVTDEDMLFNQQLYEHFKDRPAVTARIDDARKVIEKLTAPGVGADEAKDLRKQLDDLKKSISQQFSYDEYAKQTISRLAQDNITYTEQSNSSKKLNERFDPEQVDSLKKQLISEQQKILDSEKSTPDERAVAQKRIEQLKNLQIANLTMVNTANFGTRDFSEEFNDPKRSSIEEFKAKDVKTLVEQVKRNDIAGVDIAGAEHFRFDEGGQARMRILYDELAKVGTPEKPIVLRPHVGEGANDATKGEQGHRDTNRRTSKAGDELSHYDRARHNIDMMLVVFEDIAKANNGELPKNVIVRFGHVTHATPEQAARMKKLGIIAEVNLSSNVETGSVDQNPGGAKRAPEVDGKLKHQERLEDHSLPSLIKEGAPIILSTDAHEVMDTNLKQEYDKARQIIEDVRSGKQKIRISVAEAEERGVDINPGPPPHGLVTYKQLNDVEKQRFDNALEKLYADANKYYENRPKRPPGEEPTPAATPHDAGPSAGPASPTVEEAKTKQAEKGKLKAHIDQLAKDLQSDNVYLRTKAQSELDQLRQHPDKEIADEAKLAGVYQTAKKHQPDKDGKAVPGPDTELLSDNITRVLDEQKKARVGADPHLQQKRENFERQLALEILRPGSELREKVDVELARLCEKAADYILRTRSGDELDEAFSAIGTKKEKGYGGGLNETAAKDASADEKLRIQKVNAERNLKVLTEGNVRERMLALGGFMEEILGKDALSAQGKKRLEAVARSGSEGDGKFSAQAAKDLLERVKQYEKTEKNAEKRSARKMFAPTREEGETKHADYAYAKSQDMDTKLPVLEAEAVGKHLDKPVTGNEHGLVGAGEESPLARTKITVKEAQERGLALSKDEVEAAGGENAPLNWVVGQVANMINPAAPFVAEANAQSMPLKSGVSGTTYRWMKLVEVLGGDPNLARLAAIASLQASDAHSFHEIAVAAKGFGVGYDSKSPYSNIGMSQAQLEAIAAKAGVTLEELNGTATGAETQAPHPDSSGH